MLGRVKDAFLKPAFKQLTGFYAVAVAMTFRGVLLTTLLLSLVVAAPASAKYRVGLGEQDPAMFGNTAWQSLKLKRVRYLVPWDYTRHAGQRAEVDHFMNTARMYRQDVLVTFTARRGCYDGRRYSRAAACRAPSAGAYRRAVRAFDDAYPWVRTYSTWNEVNHVSQPTYRSPRRAAHYYGVLRRMSRRRHFRVMAADVLDTSNLRPYLRAFLRRAPGRPRLWGLHNYQDVNRRTYGDTRDMLRLVRGRVWLTETGGVVKFGESRQFGYSESRAANRTRWMFRLAGRYDERRRGLRSRITRLYVYRWFGEPPGAHFDAGLVDPDGTPRQAYSVFAEHARSQR
jgi:Glycosyl hydrolase catalytic core